MLLMHGGGVQMEVGKPHNNCQLLVDAIILEIFGNSFRTFMVTCYYVYYRSRSRIMYGMYDAFFVFGKLLSGTSCNVRCDT